MEYEIHLTVSPSDAAALRRVGRKVLCFENVAAGYREQDCMTSVKCVAPSVQGALQQALADATDLGRLFGIQVLRTKIEAPPWHENSGLVPGGDYLETHLEVRGQWLPVRRPMMASVSDRGRVFLTLRTRCVAWETHVARLDRLIAQLVLQGVAILGRVETERAVYDSYPDRDADWERLSHNTTMEKIDANDHGEERVPGPAGRG